MEYEQIEKQMRLWRRGFIPMPKEYIEYHEKLANEAIQPLVDNGVKIHNKEMVRCGWGGGMMLLQIIVEFPNGELAKLKWHDEHSKGCWFKVLKSGGSVRFDVKDLAA